MQRIMSFEEGLTKNGGTQTALYSRAQETFNGASHLIGVVFALIFGIVLFLLLPAHSPVASYLAVIIYTVSTAWLYSASTVYHILPSGRAKQVMRVFDHCSIFIIIAGCYTPFCLIPLWNYTAGKVVIVIEWVLALIGIVLNVVDMHNKIVKWVSQALYLIMGWMIVFVVNDLLTEVDMNCFVWLLIGGVMYTVGILFYALGKKKSVMHCVWHVFVLLGTLFQFVSILYLI